MLIAGRRERTSSLPPVTRVLGATHRPAVHTDNCSAWDRTHWAAGRCLHVTQTIVPCTHVVVVAVIVFSQCLSVVFFGSFLQVKIFVAVDNSVGLFPFFMALHSNTRESGLTA